MTHAHDWPTLHGRYDDDRTITIEPSINHEVTVTIGNQVPMFLDALDLPRIVADVVLNMVYEPSPPALIDCELP